MKKFHKAFLIAAAATSVFAFASCSDDDDDDSNSSSFSTELPASSGTNEVSGKTYTLTESGITYTWEFSDSTATYTLEYSGKKRIYNYKYTYDSSNKLLSFGYTSISENGVTVSSVNEYVNMEKQVAESEGGTWTDDLAAWYTAEVKARCTTPEILKYELNGTSLKLTPYYFDGTLPTTAEFRVSTSSGYIELTDASRIKIKDNGTKYYCYPTYNNGSFSGTIYEGHGEKKVGTIAGTYTTSGTGVSGSSVKLTFTTLPDAISGLEKNNAYTLTQRSGDTGTFTQK